MSGIQRLFENGTDKKGNPIPADIDKIKAENDWAKAFVRTESGVFAFSDPDTAAKFAGEVATVVV